MGSPRQALDEALDAFFRDDARERVARWRRDPDASGPEQLAARHAGLAGPRVREQLLEAAERGLFEEGELEATAAWLHHAIEAPARARAARTVRERLAAPVPHDSDWHPMATLIARAAAEPRARERRALARSLAPAFEALAGRVRASRELRAEAAERTAWLGDVALPRDAAGEATTEIAEAILAETDDAWAELAQRVAHGARAPLEDWTDLLYVTRATRYDDLFDPRRRWRRLAEAMLPLRVALTKHVRVEPGADRLGHALAIVDVPRDVRVSGGVERGLGSERDAMCALGRAAAIAMTHPALPPVLARPLYGTVGRAIGALFAHGMSDRLFLGRALHVESAHRRPAAELALAHELAELRAEAAGALARPHLESREHADLARTHLARAWRVDLPPSLAALLLERTSELTLRAARWAAPFHVALRERFDEDWWRNPRSEEVLRSLASRGGAARVEDMAEQLGARPDVLRERIEELLG